MDRAGTWMVIPVYNEEQVIGDVVRAARVAFPNVVCVDDGSVDASAERIHAAGAHLVRHPVNLGQGAALQTGIEYARAQPGARFFVTFDADGQHQTEDAVRMVERLQHEDVDMIVGTRFQPGTATGHIPPLRRFALRMVVLLSTRSRRLGLTDAHNGLRAFNLRVARSVNIKRGGMSHASEMVELIDRNGWRVAEEPVTVLYTPYARAKGQSLVNGVNIVFENVLKAGPRR